MGILFLCSGNYYRSRFAEALFNHHASRVGLRELASSAGLTPELFHGNPGPVSRHVVAALAERGIPFPPPYRLPIGLTTSLLREATRVVAVKEREHRPLMMARFPDYADRIEYWHVDDVDVAPPDVVLPLLEASVLSLVDELGACRAKPDGLRRD